MDVLELTYVFLKRTIRPLRCGESSKGVQERRLHDGPESPQVACLPHRHLFAKGRLAVRRQACETIRKMEVCIERWVEGPSRINRTKPTWQWRSLHLSMSRMHQPAHLSGYELWDVSMARIVTYHIQMLNDIIMVLIRIQEIPKIVGPAMRKVNWAFRPSGITTGSNVTDSNRAITFTHPGGLGMFGRR